jgi:hypothetical protein
MSCGSESRASQRHKPGQRGKIAKKIITLPTAAGAAKEDISAPRRLIRQALCLFCRNGEQSDRDRYRYLARRLTWWALRSARLHDPVGAGDDPFGYAVTAFGNLVDSPWRHGLKIIAAAVVAQVV